MAKKDETNVKRLLTIQDVSCVGQCSVTVALPVVSACGVECAVLPGSVLSNHTGGFKGWSFRDLTDEFAAIEKQWLANGIAFDAFYTGYVSPHQVEPILSILRTCAKPGALKIVDPAMADNGLLYKGFAPDFPSEMARLVAVSDYCLPNLTEAALLLGKKLVLEGYDTAYIEELARGICALGAKTAVITGVSFKKDELGSCTFDGRSFIYDFNPRLKRMAHGTGDVFASVFTGCVLRGLSAREAAAVAADVVCDAILATPDGHWYGVSFERALPKLIARLAEKGLC